MEDEKYKGKYQQKCDASICKNCKKSYKSLLQHLGKQAKCKLAYSETDIEEVKAKVKGLSDHKEQIRKKEYYEQNKERLAEIRDLKLHGSASQKVIKDGEIHEDPLHNCKLCNRVFKKQGNLLKHVQDQHPNYPEDDVTKLENEILEKIEKQNKKDREYYANNKQNILKKKALKYEENKESILENNRKSYHDNKNYYVATRKNYYKDNKETLLSKNKKYYWENKEEISSKRKKSNQAEEKKY